MEAEYVVIVRYQSGVVECIKVEGWDWAKQIATEKLRCFVSVEICLLEKPVKDKK